ncbi:MAG: heavy metal translocating P-type ATPase [Devosia sp.]
MTDDDATPRSLAMLLRWLRDTALVSVALLGLTVGGLAYWGSNAQLAGVAWTIATVPVLVALLAEIVVALRHADVGLDVIAALSMTAALVFGEPLAANVVALMYAGGQLLERYAEGRARREMTALLGRVARTAMRRRGVGLEEVSIEALQPGDTLLIRQGEVLPVDGNIAPAHRAMLDLSALTGEALPQAIDAGAEALSGATSLGAPFDLIASRPAKDSAYAGIVRLVEVAQRSRSPTMRLADRYSVGFLAVTLLLAAVAWLASGDPARAIAVLVVATPCPLILAVPIAFISGMSRTASSGLLVKSAGVFESLARIRVAIVDKTGTLTHGSAEISRIATANGFTPGDVLRYAASLDQASGHVLAATLVRAAVRQGLQLISPANVSETPGTGIEGMVEGRSVAVGGDGYVRSRIQGGDPPLLHRDGAALTVAVAIDGHLAGVIELEDRIRDDARSVIDRLRAIGVSRVVLASGDRAEIAQAVGAAMGADEILSSVTPAQKVEAVRAARQYGPTMMVGDGVNDAPALAAADVGVAMGARGSAASSETAGAVLLVDALAPLALGLEHARRSRTIALQSVWIGLSLSGLAMVFAALGFLPPVQGALLQEAIDVAVILNALRALR